MIVGNLQFRFLTIELFAKIAALQIELLHGASQLIEVLFVLFGALALEITSNKRFYELAVLTEFPIDLLTQAVRRVVFKSHL